MSTPTLTLYSTCDQTLHYDGAAYHLLAGHAVALPEVVARQLATKPDIILGTATAPRATRQHSPIKKLATKVKKAITKHKVKRPRKVTPNS